MAITQTVNHYPGGAVKKVGSGFATVPAAYDTGYDGAISTPAEDLDLGVFVVNVEDLQLLELGMMITDADGEQVVAELSRWFPFEGDGSSGVCLPILEATFTASAIDATSAGLTTEASAFVADTVSVTSSDLYPSSDNAKVSTGSSDLFPATVIFDAYGVQANSAKLIIRVKDGSSAPVKCQPFLIVHG